MTINIPDLGVFDENSGLKVLTKCSDGNFEVGKEGVEGIFATGDGKVEFICTVPDGIEVVKTNNRKAR